MGNSSQFCNSAVTDIRTLLCKAASEEGLR